MSYEQEKQILEQLEEKLHKEIKTIIEQAQCFIYGANFGNREKTKSKLNVIQFPKQKISPAKQSEKSINK
mgnify:CR=1 FL=1